MFSLFGFSIQLLCTCHYYCQRGAFVFGFQHTFMWRIKHFSRFYRSYEGKNCIDLFLTHLGTRMWRASYQIFYQKWFFWPSKHWCPFSQQAKKTSFPTLNVMISQTVRNLSSRFGIHDLVQVMYWILWLHTSKYVIKWKTHLALKEGIFEGTACK